MPSNRAFCAQLALAVFLAFGALLHAAATSHFPTTDDLRHLKAMSTPRLSPDGSEVLFTVTDSTADGAKSHLWLVATSGGADTLRQLTYSPPSDKRGERNAEWSPDGKAIFFLAHRGEHTQLFRLDMRGGEAAPYDLKVMPLVDQSKAKDAIPPASAEKKDGGKQEDRLENRKVEPLAIDVNGYAISADGKWLAVWARDPQTPGEKKENTEKADAVWVNHDPHGSRLYLVALNADGALNGGLKLVTIQPNVRSAVWSPASDRLLVVTESPNDLSDLGPAGKVWLVDASAPEKPTQVTAAPATIGGAAFSPDGKTIVFGAQTPEDAPPGYDELFALHSFSAEAKPIRLSAGFLGQLNSGTLYFPVEGSSLAGSLIAAAGIGTRASIVRLSLDGKTKPAVIDLGAAVIAGLNTNRKQTGWVWLAESGGQPVRLCTAAKLGNPCTALPTPELAPKDLRSIAPEVVHWKSGPFTVEGLLYLPPQAKSGKVPLIVDIHGGPFGAWENRHDPYADFFLGHGWAIFRPNPRGSSNYGVAFAAANKNDLGGGDYNDIMAGVDYVLSKFPLDPEKMALMGYSYGGEMAAFVEGKTDRFKAIISGAPVIDQFSEYGTEGGSWYDRWYFGKPWERMADAWRQSPLSGAAKAKTPFLLLQGQGDTTDPLGQSEEMYRALRQEGVPVELVTYPRENHGPLAIGIFGRPSPEPWHGYDGRQRIVEFLNKAFGVANP